MATTTEPDRDKIKKFAGQILADIATTMQGALSYIGDRLGIFKAMAETGPVTVDELANKTGSPISSAMACAFRIRLSIIAMRFSAVSSTNPYSSCSSLFATCTPPGVPGSVRGETPESVKR